MGAPTRKALTGVGSRLGPSAGDPTDVCGTLLELNNTVMKKPLPSPSSTAWSSASEPTLQTEKSNVNLNTLGIVLDAVKMRVGDQTMPELLNSRAGPLVSCRG